MIVRKDPKGGMLLLGQTDHSRLAGLFGSHWGNDRFAAPEPYEPVARAAHFHDFGYLRYETAPAFNAESHETPNFRDVLTDAKRLGEYQWCFDWLLGEEDPYAGFLVNMHRTGLWRGRYNAMVHPEHKIRKQPAEVDAFTERNEAWREKELAKRGWDPQQIRINYRLLQLWDLFSLYFSCGDPAEEYFEPVPRNYQERDGEGVRITLTPAGDGRIAVENYPFDIDPLPIQLAGRRFATTTFESQDAFRKAFFQAPLEILQFELFDAAAAAGRGNGARAVAARA